MNEFDYSSFVACVEMRADSHYPDGVVSMGDLVEMLGMAGGKLLYMYDGDAGLMRHFSELEFVAAAYEGDYLQAEARLLSAERTSRKIAFEIRATARRHGVGTWPTHGDVLDEPLLICRGEGIGITPLDRQRLTLVKE